MSASTFRVLIVLIVLLFLFGIVRCQATVQPANGAPMPDPPVASFVTYTYTTPAVYKNGPRKGEPIKGWQYRCTVPAVFGGHPNWGGHRHCVLFRAS